MDTYKKFTKVRAKERKSINSKISTAINGLTPKMAALQFDLSHPSHKKLDTSKNATVKALELVSNLLAKFSLPSKPMLQYHGIVKRASDKNGVIEDGIIKIGAELRTLMGHKAHIDIPVIVRSKSLLEPAVFFYDGAPYVMCGPAFDELVKRGTLMKDLQQRTMLAPPLDVRIKSDLPRSPITNLHHMYDTGPRNPWTFRRHSNKTAQAGPVDVPAAPSGPTASDEESARLSPNANSQCQYCGLVNTSGSNECTSCSAPLSTDRRPIENQNKTPGSQGVNLELSGSEPTLELMANKTSDKEPRKRTNIDTPTEFPEVWEDEPQQHLDPAERESGDISVGSKVKLLKDYEVRDRGGATVVVPSGEEGLVRRNETGKDHCLYVEFKSLDLFDVVPKKFLKKAANDKQIDYFVQEMIREGYQPVDIKAAIKEHYPEQADKALKKLGE